MENNTKPARYKDVKFTRHKVLFILSFMPVVNFFFVPFCWYVNMWKIRHGHASEIHFSFMIFAVLFVGFACLGHYVIGPFIEGIKSVVLAGIISNASVFAASIVLCFSLVITQKAIMKKVLDAEAYKRFCE